MTEIKQFSPLITIIIIIVHWSQLKQIILLVLYHWMFDCRWPFHEYVHNIYINIKWLSNDVSFTKEEILEIFGFIVPWNVIFFDLVVEYKLYRIHGIDLCRPHFRTSRIIFILSYVDKNILMNMNKRWSWSSRFCFIKPNTKLASISLFELSVRVTRTSVFSYWCVHFFLRRHNVKKTWLSGSTKWSALLSLWNNHIS